MSRAGQKADSKWVQKVQPVVEAWASAAAVVVPQTGPHTEESFAQYLRWYLPRTRVRVTFPERDLPTHEASVVDTYPTQRDENYSGAVSLINWYLVSYFIHCNALILYVLQLQMLARLQFDLNQQHQCGLAGYLPPVPEYTETHRRMAEDVEHIRQLLGDTPNTNVEVSSQASASHPAHTTQSTGTRSVSTYVEIRSWKLR
jgi:hypothetical protein